MGTETSAPDIIAIKAAKKRRVAERRDVIRRFTDQFENESVEISPRWRSVIDNYVRIQRGEAVEIGGTDKQDDK